MRRRAPWWLVLVVAVAAVVAGLAVPRDTAGSAGAGGEESITWQAVTVERVVDGDTLWTSAGKVRLIGFDTPETDTCGYQEATDRLAGLVAGGTVELGNPASVDDADRYERLLRYLRVGGRDVGEVLIEEGLAVARYDSVDGYDWHPYQEHYRELTESQANVCG